MDIINKLNWKKILVAMLFALVMFFLFIGIAMLFDSEFELEGIIILVFDMLIISNVIIWRKYKEISERLKEIEAKKE